MNELNRRCARAMFQVGNPAHTRLTNTLYGEQAPAPISGAAIEDEAWPTRIEANQVCVRIVERTASSLDRPLSNWDIEINDVDAPVDEETISVADYSYRGERPIFAATAVSKNAFASMALTEPTTETFRVFERSAEVCGPPSKNGEIRVKATMMDGPLRTRWWEAFEWSVR